MEAGKIRHPHRMTVEEVKQLLKIMGGERTKTFIDLFGGSGIVSRFAAGSFKEVIYNDWKLTKFTSKEKLRACGIEPFQERYEEILGFADKKSIIFADPPFFAMSDFNNWTMKDHIEMLKRLSDVDARVFMLNSAEFSRLAEKVGVKLIRLKRWDFRQEDPELRDRMWFYEFK